MQTKLCRKCGRELPLSEFGRLTSGYLRSWCKACCCEDAKKRYKENPDKLKSYLKVWRRKQKEKKKTLVARERFKREKEFKRDVCGGWKMFCLTHVKQGERKYNAVSMGGEVFKTNDKREFIRFLEEKV